MFYLVFITIDMSISPKISHKSFIVAKPIVAIINRPFNYVHT